ncbi:MAG: tRNA-dihydrouridine synthase [Candidatus Dadabacteria bacterium]|nr:MAG: tRNA-dihydrouridine synthase [Candidatus Dadabacteria bacterium]
MASIWQRLSRPIKILAPMEDVTDTVFRRIIARLGRPDLFFTEFTSADGLMSPGREKVIHRLKFTEAERPIIAQIWGNNPDNYYHAARLLVELGFDGIDINMGCPVPKVVKNGACSALIENRSLARELILAAMEGAAGLPVSVKTRIGFNKIATEEWVGFLLELKPAAVTLHARTARQMSKAAARWEEIKKAVNLRDSMKSKALIIGNGDVSSLNDLYTRAEKYCADGVMVGRAVFDDLYFFNEEKSFKDLNLYARLTLLREHLELYYNTWRGERGFGELKKFFKIYASGFRGASALRSALVRSESVEECQAIIKEFLESTQFRLPKQTENPPAAA